ncbi:VOC family protein [Amycolatopsis echigonensis]|uniref:VOC family protein n=1 Tax=Amycolatopsis echigonensis TaxID=2576905 RepID=A0A8E1W4A9_9PSEU|nr:VOC family protein [Amycolatopsis echigonensis]MBB2503442.1 VOC family protein [Amycolatopsis echigonensis]
MGIQGVHKILVEVTDLQRAKTFWSEIAGFEVTTDVPYDDQGNRWVELTSPDGTIFVLNVVPEVGRGSRPELPTAGYFFYADDVERTYRELSAKGVDFPAKPEKQPWGWWAMFTDSEGNRFALQQRE